MLLRKKAKKVLDEEDKLKWIRNDKGNFDIKESISTMVTQEPIRDKEF